MVLFFLKLLSFGDQKYQCFDSLQNPSRPMSVHYFSNSKAWMNIDIMEIVLDRLNRRMNFENRNVILFRDNVMPHVNLKVYRMV